jgi:hypothetical protein
MTDTRMYIISGPLGHFSVEHEPSASIDPLVTRELCELFAEMADAYMLATPSTAARRQVVQWRARLARLLEQLVADSP